MEKLNSENGNKVRQGLSRAGSKFQYPTFYLPLALGIVLVWQALEIQTTLKAQHVELQKGLQSVDDFCIGIVDGVNEFTQEIPVKIKEAVDSLLGEFDYFIRSTYDNTWRALNSTLTDVVAMIASAINSVLEEIWVSYRWTPPSQLSRTDIPPGFFNPNIPMIDLSSIIIPHLPFSAKRSIGPVVSDVFDVVETVIWYIFVIGLFLIIIVVLPLIYHLLKPCLPPLFKENKFGQVCVRFVRTMTKKHIYIPLLCGLFCCFLSVVLLGVIAGAEARVRAELQGADNSLAEFIQDLNELNSKILGHILHHLNSIKQQLNTRLVQVEGSLTNYLVEDCRRFEQQVAAELNSLLSHVGVSFSVSLPLPETSIKMSGMFQKFPDIDISDLAIPQDILSTEKTLLPIILEILEAPKKIAALLGIGGLCMMIIPLLTIIVNMLKPLLGPKLEAFKEKCTPELDKHFHNIRDKFSSPNARRRLSFDEDGDGKDETIQGSPV